MAMCHEWTLLTSYSDRLRSSFYNSFYSAIHYYARAYACVPPSAQSHLRQVM